MLFFQQLALIERCSMSDCADDSSSEDGFSGDDEEAAEKNNVKQDRVKSTLAELPQATKVTKALAKNGERASACGPKVGPKIYHSYVLQAFLPPRSSRFCRM